MTIKTGDYYCAHGPEALRNLRARRANCFSRLRVNGRFHHKCRYNEGHKGRCRCIESGCSVSWKQPTGKRKPCTGCYRRPCLDLDVCKEQRQ